MGILITKRKQMRKLFIRTLALALCLTGTAQALRAQETTAAQTAAAADQRPTTAWQGPSGVVSRRMLGRVSCMVEAKKPQGKGVPIKPLS